MEIESIIDKLIAIKNQLSRKKLTSVDCYLFGSVLKDFQQANDIDILIIYKTYNQVSIIKDEFEFLNIEYPLDLNFFTFKEEKELDFIKLQKAKKIFSI